MEQMNHAKQLLVQLNQQRSRGYLCDVIIVVENALFRAHKNVLSASSSYFKSLLLHDNLLNLDAEIITPSIFKQVLDFIYTGSVGSPNHLSDQGVADLLRAASYLQVSHLAVFCHRRLRPSSSSRTPPVSSSSEDLLQSPNGHLSLVPYPFSNPSANHHGHHARGAERRAAALEGHHQSRDMSQGEGFGSRWASRHPFAVGSMMDTSVEVMRDLGMNLTRNNPTGLPTGSGTATEDVSFLNGVGQSQTPASNTTRLASPNHRWRENSGQRFDPLRSRMSDAEQQQSVAQRKRPRASAAGEKSLLGTLLNGHRRTLEEEASDDMVHGDDDGLSLEERSGDLGSAQEEEVSANQTEPCSGIISVQKESGEEAGATACSYPQFSPGGGDDAQESPIGDNLYMCIPCGQGFSSSEQLNAHVEAHTSEELYLNIKLEEEDDTPASQPPCDIWHQAGALVDSRTPLNTSEKDEDEDDAADRAENQPEGPSREETEVDRSHPHQPQHWLAAANATRSSFPCALCGKLFTQRGTMTRHMRSHLGLKPFACQECGMRFTRQYRLTEHARVHTGEKPYRCQLCGGKFTQQRNLISHLRMHTLATKHQ